MKILKVFLPFLFLFNAYLSAAAPITHAYLTERFFVYFPQYTEEERNAFMLGTLFPDIQYLGEVQRSHTHMETSLDEILNEPSPFMAGVKFHSYVDIVREDFVVHWGAYDQLAALVEPQSTKCLCTMLKFIEDEYTFYMADWDPWRDQILNIHPEEYNWGISPKTIRKWHNILFVTFSHPPSSLLFLVGLTGSGFFGLTSAELAYWGKMLRFTAYDESMRIYVSAMLEHFENLFRERLSHGP